MKESKDSQRVLPKRSGGRTNFSAKLQRFIRRSSAAQRALLAVMLVAVIGAAGGIGYLATNAATTSSESDGSVWTTEDGLWDYCWDWEHDYQVTIVAYNGTDTDITFPSSIEHFGVSYTVVAVDLLHDGSEFFPNVGRANVTSMTFPSSYTAIGNCDVSTDSNATLNVDSTATSGGVFSNMTSLEEVTLYGNVSDYAFYGCTSLKSVVINYGCTNIGVYAFSGCSSLVNITLPSSLKSIETYAFQGDTSLTKIIIPSSVTSIGTCAFYNCTALETVSLSKNVTTIDNGTFNNCTSLKSINLSNVTTLNAGAFYNCTSLTGIDLSSVTTVNGGGGYGTFMGCTSLTSSDIAGLVENLTTIPYFTFYGCTGLTSVDLSNVTSVGDSAFYGCTGLTSVDLSNVTTINGSAFRYCTGLTSVDLSGATTIGSYAFQDCTGLTSVDLYDVTLSSYTFGNCTNLTTVNMYGATVTNGYSFYGCSKLATINITGAANVASYTFAHNSSYFTTSKALTTLYIAEGAGATINGSAFMNQTNLSEVTLTGAISVGAQAFYNCTGLTSVDLSSATTIGSNAFYGCTSLTTVNIPQITTINGYVFYNCTSLEYVNAPNVTYVDACAFSYCTNFTTTTIDFTKVYYYGSQAFQNCSKLDIGDIVMTYTGNITIGMYAFDNCDGVTSVTVTKPYGNIYLYNYAFRNCDNITEATFNGYINTYGNYRAQYVFQNCTSLEKVTFGPYCSAFLAYSSSSNYQLPFYCFFNGCTNITDVYFYTTNRPYTCYNSEANLASGTATDRGHTTSISYSFNQFLYFPNAANTVNVHCSSIYAGGSSSASNLYYWLDLHDGSSYNYQIVTDLGDTELELETTTYSGTLSAQTVYPSGSYTYTYNDSNVTATYSYPVAFFYEESPTMSCPWSYSDDATISSSNTAFYTTNSASATVSSSGAVTVGAGTGAVAAYTLRSDITTDKAIQWLNTVVMDKATIYATSASFSYGNSGALNYMYKYDDSGTKTLDYAAIYSDYSNLTVLYYDNPYFSFGVCVYPAGSVAPTVSVTLEADDGETYDISFSSYGNYPIDYTNYTYYGYYMTSVPKDDDGNFLTGKLYFKFTIQTGEDTYEVYDPYEDSTRTPWFGSGYYIVDADSAKYDAYKVAYTSTSDNNVVNGTSGESSTSYYLAAAYESSTNLYYGDAMVAYTSDNGTEYVVVQEFSSGDLYVVDPYKYNESYKLDLESLGLSDTYAGTLTWDEVDPTYYGAVYEDEAAMYVCSYVIYGDTTGGASLELVKSDDSSISSKNMSQYAVNGITYAPSVDVAAVTFSEDAVTGSVTLMAYLPNGCTATKTIYYNAPSTSSDDDDDDSTSYIDGGRPDSSDDEDEVWASSASFANSSVTLYVGQTYDNAATVTPASNNDELYYFSYNSNIVTIDSETGKLTAVSTGETKVGVSTSSGLYATAAVTVVSADESVDATAISATVSTSPVEVGDVVSLKTTLTPSDATVTLSYASSDTSVATVSSSGNITAVGIGTTTITVTATNKDGSTVTTTYKLTVSSNATAVSATVSSGTVYVGDTVTISATLTPSDATATLSYASSNTSVATVSSGGTITAKAAGTATITVTATNTDGSTVKTTYKLTVSEIPVTSVTLNKTSATVTSGDTLTLTATVSPSTTTASVTWSTSNSKIATVSSSGKVTTVGYGSVTITAKAGSKTATCTIFVEPDLDFTILGGSVRVSDPYGIRFGIQLGKTGDYGDVTIVEYGTLILPTEKLGSSELTTSTDSVLKVVGEKIYSETSSALVYTGVLINIPTSYFDTAISGRGYLIYKDTNGTQHTIYTDTVSRTFNGVAQSAYNSYVKISNPTTEQTAILNKLKELLNK